MWPLAEVFPAHEVRMMVGDNRMAGADAGVYAPRHGLHTRSTMIYASLLVRHQHRAVETMDQHCCMLALAATQLAG
jgi:hypothetical protein